MNEITVVSAFGQLTNKTFEDELQMICGFNEG